MTTEIEVGGEDTETLIQMETAKPKKTMSEEQRAARLEQLARGRATRDANAAARKAAGKTVPKKTAATVRAKPGPTPAVRADEAREDWRNLPEDQITRRRREDRTVGALNVPAHLKKPGWDYLWLAIRVLNEPVDGARLRDFREGGWQPVLNSQMPELADEMAQPNSPIESEGCRLLTRPLRLTREAQQEDLEYSLQQQSDKMRAAAQGREEGLFQKGATRPMGGLVQIEGVAGS